MTVAELIEALQKFPPDGIVDSSCDVVRVWDSEYEKAIGRIDMDTGEVEVR